MISSQCLLRWILLCMFHRRVYEWVGGKEHWSAEPWCMGPQNITLPVSSIQACRPYNISSLNVLSWIPLCMLHDTIPSISWSGCTSQEILLYSISCIEVSSSNSIIIGQNVLELNPFDRDKDNWFCVGMDVATRSTNSRARHSIQVWCRWIIHAGQELCTKRRFAVRHMMLVIFAFYYCLMLHLDQLIFGA